ncbi:DUF262 domain-containing protein [Chloroflexota bacterium]
MTNSAHKFNFEILGIGSVLKRHQLAVPANQREYRWGERQVQQLFQDYAKAFDDDSSHFLGTVVTITQANGALEIVDGQQRLATTAIFLATMRDYLETIKEVVLVESINSEFLTGIDRTRRERVPRIKLNIDDNDLFSNIITKKQDQAEIIIRGRESHSLLIDAQRLAAGYVRKIVAVLDVKDHGDLLGQWLTFIENQVLVVLLQVVDNSDAFKMFETLNDRGLRTSQVDLIKNYLFGRSGGRFNEVQSRWAHMRGALETLGEDDITIDFLRHALIVATGFVREAQIYERVQANVRSEQSTVTFTTVLENLANSYVASFNPEHEKWNEYPDTARRAIEVFNLFDIRPMRPLILAIAYNLRVKEATESFNFLTVLGVRLLIASNTRGATVERTLAGVAHNIYLGDIKTFRELKKALSDITPIDIEFKGAFASCKVSIPKLARYYLRSLEMAAKSEPEPWFMPVADRSIINLEHILPKNPEGKWPQFNPEEADNYVNRLGNQTLMLAKDNSDLRSAAFPEKRKIYEASPYVITSQLAEVDDWNPNMIGKRQEILSEFALKAWPIS